MWCRGYECRRRLFPSEADSRSARDGRYIERLGYFNPIAVGQEKRIELDKERVSYWVGQGAKPSDRVRSILNELDNPEVLEKRQAKKVVRKAKKKAQVKAKLEAESEAKAKSDAEKSKPEAEEKEEAKESK